MSDRSLRGRMNTAIKSCGYPVLCSYAKSLNEVEQSVSFLLQLLVQEQYALMNWDHKMTEREKTSWLHYTQRILKSISLLQDCLLSKYELLNQWDALGDQITIMNSGPSESDMLDKFHAFTQSHPQEWKKIRLQLHEIFAFQQRKAKMPRPNTENIHTQPWLSPLIDNRRSKGYTDN
ncbi:hypothetical protein ACTNDP_01630 [Paenibacillus barengoltzii]|uniref:hypothetical protein n=1 Tax=Paenibacillus barengoltzii TaxID=343517 RepID=UPI003F8AAA29